MKPCAACGQMYKTYRPASRYCSLPCANRVIAQVREDSRVVGTRTTVWSCGGGVQSTAIAAMIREGRIPKPDLALMTDTGYERDATMEHVRMRLIPELAQVGVTLHILKTTDYGSNALMDKDGFVAIPAYKRGADGEVVKLGTRCSMKWKLATTFRWLHQQGVKIAENWVGISSDEARRARVSDRRWITLRYPLVEMGLSREDCLWLIANHGWPQPHRTSCVFCPQQNDASWAFTKGRYPQEWARVIAAEAMIQQSAPQVYLHRSLQPIDQVDFAQTMVVEEESLGCRACMVRWE